KQYLQKELMNAGISTIVIQKTPLATRVAIRVKKPSMVIGKKGATVKSITEKLEKDFGVDNPQLDIIEVENPSLDAKLVAERIARQIEIEGNIKQIMRMNLRDVKEAGAIGTEIICSGKVVGKGGKAKALKMRHGYMKKAGDLLKLIDMARAVAYLKAGAIGVTVKIVHPDVVFPDSMKIDYEKVAQGVVEGVVVEKTEEQKAIEEEAEKKMKEKIAAAKKEAKERAERRRKFHKPVKKKPTYEAENLIKSAEEPSHKPAEAAGEKPAHHEHKPAAEAKAANENKPAEGESHGENPAK
ncbi:MAG: 30S ribosomal protein S3, partial [Candidatus Micrarchaeota archaeon]